MLGLFLAVVNQTIVATALPGIAADLDGGSEYAWVLTAFLLAAIVSAPLFGRLSDVHGRRPLFLAAVVLFLIGGAFGAAAQTMGQLIAARAVHGLGAGALMSLAFIVIADLAPPSDRGRWQAAAGTVLIVGSVVGPMAGGWIVDHASWRWVLLVSLPPAAVALVAGALVLRIPPHPDRDRRVDLLGAALLAGALTGILLGTSQLATHVPPSQAAVPLALGAAAAAFLVRHERRTAVPFVPLDLLRDPLVRVVSLAYLFVGAGMFGAILAVPLFVQRVLGDSGTGSGLVLMPLMLAMNAASIASGHGITRSGRYRWAILPGPVVAAVGFVLLARTDEGSGLAAVIVATVVIGLGLGLLIHNLLLVVQNGVPSRHLGMVTGAAQLFRNTGAATGVAVMGAVLAPDLARLDAGEDARVALADALEALFLGMVPLLLATFVLLLRVPDLPLRPAVREEPTAE